MQFETASAKAAAAGEPFVGSRREVGNDDDWRAQGGISATLIPIKL